MLQPVVTISSAYRPCLRAGLFMYGNLLRFGLGEAGIIGSGDLGDFFGDDDPVGMFGDEVRNLADVSPESAEGICHHIVRQLFKAESFECPKKRAAEAVESELTADEDLAAGLEIAESNEHNFFDLDLFRPFAEQTRLDRRSHLKISRKIKTIIT
jgi:hypothetical protein